MMAPELARKRRGVKARAEQMAARPIARGLGVALFRAGGDQAQEEDEEDRRRARPCIARVPWRAIGCVPLVAGAGAGGAHPGLPAGQSGLDADDLGAAHRRPDPARLGLLRRHVEMDGHLGRRLGGQPLLRPPRGRLAGAGQRHRHGGGDRPAARRLDHRHADGAATCSCGRRAPMSARRWKSRWRSISISSSASAG